MFEFLFRRGKSAAKTPAANPPATGKTGGKQSSQSSPAPAPPSAATRQATTARLREEALAQAQIAARDEAAAIAFVCACGVPEARLVAAQAIHGRSGLEQVHRALRETDRRVARLMQQRLDQLGREQAAQRQAEAGLLEARRLVAEPVLRANQVVALEQTWHAIVAVPDALQQEYGLLHAALGQRLQAQAALQRHLLDAIAAVRATLAAPETAVAAAGGAAGAVVSSVASSVVDAAPNFPADSAADPAAGTPDPVMRAAEDADRILQTVHDDPELPGLPRHLLPELTQLRAQLQSRLDATAALAQQQASRAAAAREALLARERTAAAAASTAAAESEASQASQPSVSSTAPAPAAPDATDATPTVPNPRTGATPPKTRLDPAQREQHAAALTALQAALEEGALLKAMEQDRLLRSLDGDDMRLPPTAKAALQAARAELGRLQSWARWGGAVSRDELVASVEALPQQALPIGELAKKVGSMRERWRSLDASAGAAPRAAWVRFDAACTAAYAPVAAHTAALSAQRAANADQAKALLAEIDAFRVTHGFGAVTPGVAAAVEHADRIDGADGADADAVNAINPGAGIAHAAGASGNGEPDWRALSAFCQRMRHAWQRLGPLERREQKRLDTAFAHALQPLLQLLDARQAHELAARERLIADVTALAPQARDTPERLQALQARWQQQAKSVPLPRQQEQAAWVQFRAACDAVFAARKQVGAAADAQRAASLAQKNALCEELESMAATIAQDVHADADAHDSARPGTGAGRNASTGAAAHLRAIRSAWDAAGMVPRAAQDAVQARYNAAIARIEKRLDDTRRAAVARQRDAVGAALMLCLDTEQQACLRASANGIVDTEAGSGADPAAAARDAWQHVPTLPKQTARDLQRRFESALQALMQPDPQYARRLDAAQAERDALLLRLEVAYGIDSPARLMRERMAQQVAGLQSAFKGSGERSDTREALLAQLHALPALADAEARKRIQALIAAAESS